MDMSKYIARMIKLKFKNVVNIEIVDEYGTSYRGIRELTDAEFETSFLLGQLRSGVEAIFTVTCDEA